MILTLIATAALGLAAGIVLDENIPAIKARFAASHEVADITAGFRKLRDRLDAAAEHHLDRADAHLADASDSKIAAAEHKDEAVRAASASDKLTALIG